ncbi:MAG TPA: hypothetical protein PLO83_01620 [Gammaproteobacteria bacterium]|nr:hypothetical protein [Gammaproteobacteria bacterium]
MRALLLIILATLAIILYSIGFKIGSLFIFMLAAGVELSFWVFAFYRKPQKPEK